jgi:hypothetical protein
MTKAKPSGGAPVCLLFVLRISLVIKVSSLDIFFANVTSS